MMGSILFYFLISIWIMSEIAYKTTLKSKDQDQKKDQSSLKVLWCVILLSIFGSVLISKLTYFPILAYIPLTYISLLLMVIGIVGRFLVIKSLGKYFTVDVSIKQDHHLKKDGYYQLVRHPSYAFALLTFFALGLYLNNIFSFILVFAPPFWAFSYRIKIEERALIEQFGAAYLEYARTTKKLIPFIY